MTSESSPQTVPHTNALVERVLAAHGERLDEAQRAMVREHVERLRGLVAQLDAFHLENGDEPGFAFRAIDRVDAV